MSKGSTVKRPPAGPPAEEHPGSIGGYPEHQKKLALLRLVRAASKFPLPRLLADALMRKLGLDPERIRSSARTILDHESSIVESIEMPDRFNRVLGPHGWLAYESLNADVMKSAVEAAEQNGALHAEELLVSHFHAETLRYGVNRIASLRCFQARTELARLAIEDHVAGRFHASVPVVLSLVDGMVADLSPNNRGFFAEEPDLTAWESIAGHPSGLLRVAKLFSATRRTTRSDTLSYPLRHGIVHGRDLGYGNEIVSAKAWATLFAAGDWARKVERGEHLRPIARTFGEYVHEAKEGARVLRDFQEQARTWRPRSVTVPDDPNPSLNLFENSAPEHVLVQFLHAWLHRGRYGLMAQHLLPRRDTPAVTTRAGELRSWLNGLRLGAFRITKVRDAAPALTCVDAECTFDVGSVSVGYRLLFTDRNGEALPRGYDGGRWYVVNWAEPVMAFGSRGTTERSDVDVTER